jgi:hypothetical protein
MDCCCCAVDIVDTRGEAGTPLIGLHWEVDGDGTETGCAGVSKQSMFGQRSGMKAVDYEPLEPDAKCTGQNILVTNWAFNGAKSQREGGIG